jgi:hypothetical protein
MSYKSPIEKKISVKKKKFTRKTKNSHFDGMDEHEGGDDGGSQRQLTHQDPVHLTQEIKLQLSRWRIRIESDPEILCQDPVHLTQEIKTQPLADPD